MSALGWSEQGITTPAVYGIVVLQAGLHFSGMGPEGATLNLHIDGGEAVGLGLYTRLRRHFVASIRLYSGILFRGRGFCNRVGEPPGVQVHHAGLVGCKMLRCFYHHGEVTLYWVNGLLRWISECLLAVL